MIVGEQPGDHEDLAGAPFVGPAGQLFDTIAAQAGLDRDAAYITNAVKHFKFTPRGKRRIHQNPHASEIDACRIWLTQEIAKVRPVLIVALGSTAARALTGDGTGIMARCGQIEKSIEGLPVLITVHPAAALRSQNSDAVCKILLRDLTRAAQMVRDVSTDAAQAIGDPAAMLQHTEH